MDPKVPPASPNDSQPEDKQRWTPPVLKKMDIEETAIGTQQNLDADGFS